MADPFPSVFIRELMVVTVVLCIPGALWVTPGMEKNDGENPGNEHCRSDDMGSGLPHRP